MQSGYGFAVNLRPKQIPHFGPSFGRHRPTAGRPPGHRGGRRPPTPRIGPPAGTPPLDSAGANAQHHGLVRGVARIAVLAAFAVLPAFALASSTSSQVWATNCNQEQYKPTFIIATCADAGISVDKLKWSSWSTTKATAKGDYDYKICIPSCASAGIKSLPAIATLSDPKRCPKEKQRDFTELEVEFTGDRPSYVHKATENFRLGCPY
jgi:hypothetical protein